jgi:murein DD-endopeptidase MepM/ murein hydrolase activator NlpD
MSVLRRPAGRLGRRAPLGLLVALALCGAAVIPAAADPRSELKRNEDKQEELRAKIDAAEERAADLLSRIKKVDFERDRREREVAVLDARLAELRERIRVVTDDLYRTQARLAALNRELRVILADLQRRQGALIDHAIVAYKAGPSAYIEGLLAAESLGDLVTRYQYLSDVLATDATLLEQIETLKLATEDKRAEVEEVEAQIVLKRRRLQADEKALAALRAERAQALAEVEGLLATKQDLLAEVEASKLRYEQVLEQLERESEEIRALLAGGSSGSGPTGSGQLAWPADGPVTSGYGYRTHPIFGDRRFHAGIDIGAGYGAPVWASEAGEVVFAGVMSGYGNVVVVDHGGGLATTYNHLSGFSVGAGQRVSRGQQVGSVGCSGYCTGPHLHFEVRVNGEPVDPMPYLR